MKPKLKPPGTERLKLKCDILLLSSAFKINLRRYILALTPLTTWLWQWQARCGRTHHTRFLTVCA
jgi:hypothetical protein